MVPRRSPEPRAGLGLVMNAAKEPEGCKGFLGWRRSRWQGEMRRPSLATGSLGVERRARSIRVIRPRHGRSSTWKSWPRWKTARPISINLCFYDTIYIKPPALEVL